MKIIPTVLDFETEKIPNRPKQPRPVGLAIMPPGKDPMYLAWGHASENGAWKLDTAGRLKPIDKSYPDIERAAQLMYHDAQKGQVLGHNLFKFDQAVAQEHWDEKPAPWEKTYDSMFSLFLRDPHAASLSLKPSAEAWLDEPPEERDAVFDWLAQYGIIGKPKMIKGKLSYQKDAGAYICQAPGALVARYAIGDVTRSLGLHDLHMPWIDQYGMAQAYDRERELAPILRTNEGLGMRVDLPALERDTARFEKILKQVDGWVRKRLKTPGLNVDSDEEVAQALKRAGVVKEFPKTPTGRDSVSKRNLTEEFFSDHKVWAVLYYRNALATVLTMSMRPWLAEGSRNSGYVYTSWNQVRQSHGIEKIKGARSGRITCSYFQNITKDFMDRGDGFKEAWERGDLSKLGFEVPELPLVRVYLLPDEGELFGHSDFDQQELKLVAHYEDGALARAYIEDPKTDIHEYVKALIKNVTGKEYARRPVKVVDFRTVYGGGKTGLAEHLHIPYNEASDLIDDWKRALPDVVELDKALKAKFKAGEYIRTLGGRVYFVKPPTIAKKGPRKGQMIQFDYTALNYLIQPSAADQTKQAIIDYHKHPKRKARMVVTVHDEINISTPRTRALDELDILRECMVGAFALDVPVTTTLKLGPSWGKLEKIKERRKYRTKKAKREVA